MQPALQLCTKILNSNHPAIETMMDIYTRTPIPDEEDSRSANIKALSIPNRVRMSPDADINSTWLENIALKELGFDWKAVTLDYLKDNLVFCFNSIHWDIGGDKSDQVIYGLTHRVERSTRIIIEIGAEYVALFSSIERALLGGYDLGELIPSSCIDCSGRSCRVPTPRARKQIAASS